VNDSHTISQWAHESEVGRKDNEEEKEQSLGPQKDCRDINLPEGTRPTLHEGLNVRFHELRMTKPFSLFTLLA